jgi:hypothetical protein
LKTIELKKLDGMDDFNTFNTNTIEGQDIDRKKVEIIKKLNIGSSDSISNSERINLGINTNDFNLNPFKSDILSKSN